jgi:hypothetical protein
LSSFLKGNDPLFIKGETPGKKPISSYQDGSLHGESNVGFIGQFVKELDYVPISA